jgi:uncharacterized membrane protein YfcA
MNLEIYQIILIAVITLLASYIQSVAGFGFGIFAMIFLPRLLVYTEANVLSTMLSAFTSLAVVVAMRKHIHWKNIIFPFVGCLTTTLLAVNFIKTQKNETLSLLLGIALFLLSIYFLVFSKKIKIKPTWYSGLIAGALSGIMGGMFSMGGPPVVVYYVQSEEDTNCYLATLSAYFICSDAVSITTKATAGFINLNVWVAFLIGFVAMAIGAIIGKRSRDKIKPNTLKKAVYILMAISGAMNIVMALI